MPGCVLRVSGRDFEINSFLIGSSLGSCFIKPAKRLASRLTERKKTTFNFDVSSADGDLHIEVADALLFLDRHHDELQQLRTLPGVEKLTLDFGCWQRDVPAYFSYLPAELLARAGKLGLGIELSLYARETP